MVTLILLFIFLAPYAVDFNDKPTERRPRQTEVVVVPDGDQFVYQIDAAAVRGTDDAEIRRSLVRIVEPIAGEIELIRYQAVHDRKGNLTLYKAWIRKPYR
jgi:hypothetical protein